MSIRRDFYANPWRDHTRQNGIRTGRQGWRDLNATPDDPGRGIVHGVIFGACLWALIVLAVIGAVSLLD